MKKPVIVKKLTELENKLTNHQIPGHIIVRLKHDSGAVGKYIEDLVESWGYPINRSVGCDMEIFGVEFKSRNINASSAQTVGSMTEDDIISTPYEDSPICSKLQQQFRVLWHDQFQVITEAKIVNYAKPEIQSKMRSAYESGRKLLQSGGKTEYISLPGEWAHWEKRPSGVWQFRITDTNMDALIGMARTVSIFQEE